VGIGLAQAAKQKGRAFARRNALRKLAVGTEAKRFLVVIAFSAAHIELSGHT